jgi:outer membrane protein assembly factor BamB
MYRDQLEAAMARADAAESQANQAKEILAQVLASNTIELSKRQPALIYVGIAGQVLALDAVTGEIQWACKVASSNVVNVVYESGILLAGVSGKLFRIDTTTGELLWTNKLRGMGLGLPSLAMVPLQLAPHATVFVGLRSHVIAINCDSGEQRWNVELGSVLGGSTVHLAMIGGALIASVHGEVHRIDPMTGEVDWHNPLKGKGYGLASIGPVGTTAFDIQAAHEAAQRAAAAGAS